MMNSRVSGAAMPPTDAMIQSERRTSGRLAVVGLWLRRHRGLVLGLQWAVVLFYAVVVAVPAFLPLPGEADRILNNLTRFAQFLF